MRPTTMGTACRLTSAWMTLAACADRLKKDPEDRKSYVALWDTARDLTVKEGRPCLVSLFFRKFEGKLTLSATFRTHNAMDA